jgi:hypothetical protein
MNDLGHDILSKMKVLVNYKAALEAAPDGTQKAFRAAGKRSRT